MIVTLGRSDSSMHFEFKLGSMVRAKGGKTSGEVVAGHCYPDLGNNWIFYHVKSIDGKTYTYMQDDIEEFILHKNAS